MADYIEDPQIAASIDELKRRWPDIGAAADHPLTDFFLKREGTRKRWLHSLSVNFGRMASILLVYAVAAYMYPRLMERHGFILMWAGIFAYDYLRRHSKPQKEFNLTDPIQLLTGVGDASQWEQFSLLPLQYRDVAGICLGCSYHTARTHQFNIARIVLAIGIVVAAAFYLWETLNLILFVPCSLFLLLSIHVLSINPAQFLHNRIAGLHVALSRGTREELRWSNYNSQFLWILCLFALLNFILFQFAGTSGLVVNISMLAWGFLFFLASWSSNRLDLESKFRSLSEDEKPKYEKMVAEMISRK